jgi:RNA polymerase sigma-70 factor (ECF subfamily)
MRPGPGTDAELVERARRGEVAAFDHLVMRHRGRLYDIARHITGQAEAAQDVVQEALLRAFRSLDSLRDGTRFGQWLNTIVRRQSVQWHRDGRRTPEPTESAALYSLVGAAAPPPKPPEEVVALVRGALSALSQRHRQVMILHYLEGFTCEEIAGKLGVSAGRVKRILHDSRRKVRTECRAMTDTEPTGPRTLSNWMSGEVPHGEWDVPTRLHSALAQTICLSVNKRAKTVKEIATAVEAHEKYVAGVVHNLAELEVLVSPRKDTYLLNFMAFDAEDWRKLVARMREPAGEIARRLADSQEALRAAYERTPLASSGWSWDDVVWAVNCLIVANRGVPALLCGAKTQPRPMRPGGFPYWLGGYEYVPEGPEMDAPGWYGTERPAWGVGHFGPSMSHKGYDWIFGPPPRGREVLVALLEGPLPEEKMLSHFDEEEREQYRSTLAELVSKSLVERADGDAYRPTFPVWREGDSEVLAPVVLRIIEPIATEVLAPIWSDLDALLDEMGYEHRRDQYPVWRHWLCGFILGEALRFMVKQGTLPELGDSPPAKWNHAGWKGDLPLMRLVPPEGP